MAAYYCIYNVSDIILTHIMMDISLKAMSRLKYLDTIVYGKSDSDWKLFGIYLYKK